MMVYVCKMCCAPLLKSKNGPFCSDCGDVFRFKDLNRAQIVDREISSELKSAVVRA